MGAAEGVGLFVGGFAVGVVSLLGPFEISVRFIGGVALLVGFCNCISSPGATGFRIPGGIPGRGRICWERPPPSPLLGAPCLGPEEPGAWFGGPERKFPSLEPLPPVLPGLLLLRLIGAPTSSTRLPFVGV